MPIHSYGRFVGFGAHGQKPRGSPLVWDTIKSYFGRDPSLMQQIKLYHRSSPTLGNLYKSVSEYDKQYTSRPKNDSILEEILQEARKTFAPPEQVNLRHINDMKPEEFPMNTSPCLPYVQMINPTTGQTYKSKMECWDKARAMARRQAHFIKEGHSSRLYPSMVFAKGKICTRDKQKSRAIWGKPFPTLLMQAIFFRNLWNWYLRGKTPMAYRYTPFHKGYTYLRDDLELAGFNMHYQNILLSLDFSAYDTSIPPWLILEVYKMFESYINFSAYDYHGKPDPEKTRKLFWRLARECIDTRFRMPDGYEFQKRGGVDSGSFDFQLIECICTWIMIRYALRKLGFKDLFLSTLGDDSITLLEGVKEPSLADIARVILDVFGVTVNIEKSHIARSMDKAKFLGRYCRSGTPQRETADVILAALLPSRTDRTPVETAERVVALYYDSALGNFQARWFLQACWFALSKELIALGYNFSSHSWSNRWSKKFKMWGLKQPPQLKLPSDEDLFVLTETTLIKREIPFY